MFYAGIDTHLIMHEVALIDEKGESIWSGRIGKRQVGFSRIAEQAEEHRGKQGRLDRGVYT